MNCSIAANSVDIEIFVRTCREVLRTESGDPSVNVVNGVRFISDLDVLGFDESKSVAEAYLSQDLLGQELSHVSPLARILLRLPYRLSSGILRPALYAVMRPLHRSLFQFHHSIYRLLLLTSRDAQKNAMQIQHQDESLQELREEVRRQAKEIRALREKVSRTRVIA